eukprot:CAMPEP_0205941856 /NCGR_PEP_ID=MMETSP1325-20131115/56015_1 /ASSEMBLY_ACC=CAM_ASM_000708 /TAXON_ID=236786 /ORGANISM="Florenciella sp., Strain RCC1007" /LENGTH=54 /DNA_ID=CAMNT_0053312515 /DNA_START=1 /DNA_END=161 /DNA_ORIENTATION=+
MHANGLYHRDIKPANILLTDAFELKICDLGFSRLGDVIGEQTATIGGGTPGYQP